MNSLPIVTFGKYKDKPVTDLLADDKYVEWLKLQDWFSKHKPIYNIVVNQQIIAPGHNAKTPEHNKLQNMFLDKANQIKLLDNIFNLSGYNEKLSLLYTNKKFIKWFGADHNEFFKHSVIDGRLEFEGKFNWDMILLYVNNISLEFISNEDLEIKRRCKYKIQYDTEHELEHQAELDKHNELIRIREVYDKDIIDKYDDDMRKYIFIKDTHEVLYAKYIENKKIYDEELKVFITANVKKLCDTCARCDFKNYKYNACDPADCSSLTGYTQDEMRAKLYKIIEIYKLSHNVPIEIKKITAPRLNIDDE